MTEPNFEQLRAERNAAMQRQIEEICAKHGWDLDQVRHSFDSAACYCACASGGPCEHRWNGEGVELDDGRAWSATCSRCGMTAMGHDMRNGP